MSGGVPERASVAETLRELTALAHALGEPARELAILGEGNVSVNVNAAGEGETFWVKASGSSLETLQRAEVSRVRFADALQLLTLENPSELELDAGLSAALADSDHAKPSVETFLHALCLQLPAVNWVGHTHPVAVNQILCSHLGAGAFLHHVFPDAVVVCGRVPAVVPYVDPGFALARAVEAELARYIKVYGTPPKLLLLENHGVVALGGSAKEVLNITLMTDKWARVLAGSYTLGGPRFLPDDEVQRIDARLDEHYRRRRLTEPS